ncbi:MAG: hypothetical protein GKR92_04470 [Gammaproteobacteria bacterium]|nr:MAG: hypothetical protein GKR92_04470 [Gammaproteobacteria bacterium]
MHHSIFSKQLLIALSLVVFSITTTNSNANHYNKKERTCTKTAKFLKYSCGFEVRDDYLAGIAVCLNESNNGDQRDCLRETRISQREGHQECREVFRARKDLCNSIGEEPYDPPFGENFAEYFINPTEIGNSVSPNPYFPLVEGNRWVYEGTSIGDEGEEETETVTVTVTDQTKLIDGITCVTVIDVAEVDEEVVEITDDWYAQDIYGNVWYCGEISQNFELFEGDEPETPELVDTEGSWKAGRDGAKAGILLPSVPEVGEFYRQEVFWGDAEDVIEILATDATETSPGGSCNGNCLQTYDFTPLDAEANENKYYLPGTGLIVEIDLETGDRVELIEFTSN